MKRHPSHSDPAASLPSDTDYVERVLALYLSLPHTPNRYRPRDRLFAVNLWRDSVPFAVVHRAFLLASLRRLCRDPSAPALEPIRTLRYFEGAIEETLAEPTDQGYFLYLAAKMRKLDSRPDRVHGQAKPTVPSSTRYVQLRLPL